MQISPYKLHLVEDRCVIDSDQVKRIGYEFLNLVHIFEKSYAIDFLGTSVPLVFFFPTQTPGHVLVHIKVLSCSHLQALISRKVIP